MGFSTRNHPFWGFSYGFPFSYGFLWFSYGFPMVFLWFSYGFPMVFLWFGVLPFKRLKDTRDFQGLGARSLKTQRKQIGLWTGLRNTQGHLEGLIPKSYDYIYIYIEIYIILIYTYNVYFYVIKSIYIYIYMFIYIGMATVRISDICIQIYSVHLCVYIYVHKYIAR